MNWLDVVIALLLAFAVWEGWRQGVVAQTLGLAALALGVYLAWKFGNVAGEWFGGTSWAGVAGFAVVFIVVIVCVATLGYFTRGLFKIVGLGIFDSLLGVLFSLLKTFVFVGLSMTIIDCFDPAGRLITERVRSGSSLLSLVETVNEVVFPFIKNILNSL